MHGLCLSKSQATTNGLPARKQGPTIQGAHTSRPRPRTVQHCTSHLPAHCTVTGASHLGAVWAVRCRQGSHERLYACQVVPQVQQLLQPGAAGMARQVLQVVLAGGTGVVRQLGP